MRWLQAGIVPGLVLLILVAVTAHFSIFILVSVSRRCGGRSFEDVVRLAFGFRAQVSQLRGPRVHAALQPVVITYLGWCVECIAAVCDGVHDLGGVLPGGGVLCVDWRHDYSLGGVCSWLLASLHSASDNVFVNDIGLLRVSPKVAVRAALHVRLWPLLALGARRVPRHPLARAGVRHSLAAAVQECPGGLQAMAGHYLQPAHLCVSKSVHAQQRKSRAHRPDMCVCWC